MFNKCWKKIKEKLKKVFIIYCSYVILQKIRCIFRFRSVSPRRFWVDKKHHLIYLVNYKVACSSIGAAIYGKPVEDNGSIHGILSKDENICQKFILNDCEKDWYSFTFVRNPYERLVSAYENKFRACVEKNARFEFQNYLLGYFNKNDDFNSFIEKVCSIPLPIQEKHFKSQYLLTHNRFGKPLVNYIGRYENLQKDFEKIQQKYDLNPLPHFNSSGGDKRDWRQYYNLKTAKMVYKKYRKDFECFGYSHYYTELMEYVNPLLTEVRSLP